MSAGMMSLPKSCAGRRARVGLERRDQHIGIEDVDAHRGEREIRRARNRGRIRRLFLEADHPILVVDRDDAEAARLGDRHFDRRERDGRLRSSWKRSIRA